MEGLLFGVFVIVVIYLVYYGWYTERGSGIHHRPYDKRGKDY